MEEQRRLPDLKDFIGQISLVAGADDIRQHPAAHEESFRGAFVLDLDLLMPFSQTQVTKYGTDIGYALVAEAEKYANKFAILEVVLEFIAVLDKRIAEHNTQRIDAVRWKQALSKDEKREERARWESWGKRMASACWEMQVRVWLEIEVFKGHGFGLDRFAEFIGYEMVHKAMVELPELDGNREDVVESIEKDDETDYTGLIPQSPSETPPQIQVAIMTSDQGREEQHQEPSDAPQHFTDHEMYSRNLKAPISRSNRSSVAGNPPAEKAPRSNTGKGTKHRQFTLEQNKAILRWMKRNEAWSAAHHDEAMKELLQDSVFAVESMMHEGEEQPAEAGKSADGQSKLPLKRSDDLKKRLRDKMDKVRQTLIKEGAAVKEVRGEKKLNVLVFESWTDAWLNEDWDGKVKKPEPSTTPSTLG